MARLHATLLAIAALGTGLGLGACGDDERPPSGFTTVPSTTPPPTRTVDHPITVQIEALKACLGGEEVTRVDVFEPTYQFAVANGGGGFAVKLGKRQVEFFVLPTIEAAETTSTDVTSQLTKLLANDPGAYEQVRETATQTFGNVVQVVPTGTTSPAVASKIATCANESAAEAGAVPAATATTPTTPTTPTTTPTATTATTPPPTATTPTTPTTP